MLDILYPALDWLFQALMSARIIISSAQLNILSTNKSSHRHNMSSALDIMLSTPDLSMQKSMCPKNTIIVFSVGKTK